MNKTLTNESNLNPKDNLILFYVFEYKPKD